MISFVGISKQIKINMVEEIVRQLPSDLEWMVMFRIRSIKRFADNPTIIDMYFLNKDTIVDDYDFVILTSKGRFLYNHDKNLFKNGETLSLHTFEKKGLYDVYASKLELFNLNLADSFATGDYPEYGKVVLYIQFKERVAIAKSVFTQAPNEKYYDYLQAVGIKYVSGEYINGEFLATYENTLSKHIASGILADFSRTDNCNLFFFLHGNINSVLSEGILQAGKKRIQHERIQLAQRLKDLAIKSMASQLKMEVLQPFGEPSFQMGDVVPKGFLYGALSKCLKNDTIIEEYRESLENDKLRGLWTFEKDDLETSIDSALVIMNLYDEAATALLKKFQDNETKAYLPQTDAVLPKKGDMQYVPEKDHWCQPDISISALILSLLKRHNLGVEDQLENFVNENFEKRSGLYFTNPYFVDWLYAKGLSISDKTGETKKQLIETILSSVNEDFSLGTFDKVFSTACGILALEELGCEPNLIYALQLYVLNNYRNPVESQPIPFYSSLIMDTNKEGRIVTVNNKKLALYFYKDTHEMVYLSVVALSLNRSTDAVSIDIDKGLNDYVSRNYSSRYSCSTIEDYLVNYSLVNYV